jgi:HTH-type transcriptional regulator / antitoxin HigA
MGTYNTIISKALSKLTDQGMPNLNELYEEKINQLGITKHQANQIIGLDKNTITPILDYSAKTIDLFHLLKIAEFLDIENIEFLTQLYSSKLSVEKIAELEKVKKANFIIKNFNLDGLKKCGFLKGSINDFNEIERNIVAYFNLPLLYDYTDSKYSPLFSRTKRASKNNKMLFFWIRSAIHQFNKIDNKNNFDRAYLKDLIAKVKPFTIDEEYGFLKVIRALYKAGVTVIIQPYLSTTQIRGATFIIKDKPYIVLTNLNDRYPTIWFALLHELCHVLFDYDSIKENTFHLTMDEKIGDIFFDEKIEEYANEFARDYFLQESQIKYITPFINNPFMVNEYAKKQNIHPSLIYAFYCWNMEHTNNKKVWSFYQQYFPTTKKMLTHINLIPFDIEKLEGIIIEHKTILESQNIPQ